MTILEIKAELAECQGILKGMVDAGASDSPEAGDIRAEINMLEKQLVALDTPSNPSAKSPVAAPAKAESENPSGNVVVSTEGAYRLMRNATSTKFWWFGNGEFGQVAKPSATLTTEEAAKNHFAEWKKTVKKKEPSAKVAADVLTTKGSKAIADKKSDKKSDKKEKKIAELSWKRKLPEDLLQGGKSSQLGCEYLLVSLPAGTKVDLPTVVKDANDKLVVDKATGRPVFVMENHIGKTDHRTAAPAHHHAPAHHNHAEPLVIVKPQEDTKEQKEAKKLAKVDVTPAIKKAVATAIEDKGVNIDKVLEDVNESALHIWLKSMIKDYHTDKKMGLRIREIKITVEGDVYALIQDETKTSFLTFIAAWYKISLKSGNKTIQVETPVLGKGGVHLKKSELDAYYSTDSALYNECVHWIRLAYKAKKVAVKTPEAKAEMEAHINKCNASRHLYHEENLKDEIYAEIGRRRRADKTGTLTRKKAMSDIRLEIKAAHAKHKADNEAKLKERKEKEKVAAAEAKLKKAEKA